MNRILIAAAAATLMATCCQAAPANTKRTNGFVDTSENAVPQNYRELVATYLKASLVDPTSIRDAGISEPGVRRVGIFHGGRRPAVCVRYDAKNRRGLYTGASSTVYYFKGGQVVGAARRQAFCQDATYVAFTEVEPHVAVLRPAKPVPAAKAAPSRTEKVRTTKPAAAAKPARQSEADLPPIPTRTYYDARHADTWYRQGSM